jgi:hypothetical protein
MTVKRLANRRPMNALLFGPCLHASRALYLGTEDGITARLSSSRSDIGQLWLYAPVAEPRGTISPRQIVSTLDAFWWLSRRFIEPSDVVSRAALRTRKQEVHGKRRLTAEGACLRLSDKLLKLITSRRRAVVKP